MKAAIMRRLGKEEKGFTLIELLAVIVILAVIAAIAIPLIGSIINKSKKDSDVATARQIYDASRLYITSEMSGDSTGGGDGIVIPVTIGTKSTAPSTWATKGLQTQKYLDNNLVLPSTKKIVTGGEVVYGADGTLYYVHIIADNAATAGDNNFYISGAEVLAGSASTKGTAAPTTAPASPTAAP